MTKLHSTQVETPPLEEDSKAGGSDFDRTVGAGPGFSFSWGQLRAELRWRGPLRFFALVMREILSPFFYWHVLYVFEKDVNPPSNELQLPFEVRVYSGPECAPMLVNEIPKLGELPPKRVESRLAFGDSVAVAYANSQPIAYAWMSVASGMEIAFDTAWRLEPGEGIFHGSFTLAAWRGRGVQHQLDAALQRFAREQGISRVFATISAFNTPSLRAFKAANLRKLMTLVLLRVRGVDWTCRKVFGAPFASRFTLLREKGKEGSYD